MSDTSPISPVAAGKRHLKPWQVLGIWILAIAAGAALLVLFSGRVTLLRAKAPSAEPVHIAMNSAIPKLVYPPVEPLPAATPKRPAYVQAPATPTLGNAGQSERDKALNSEISAYAIRSTAHGAADTQADPVAGRANASTDHALEAELQPTRIEGTRVAELPDPRWLIEQGRILPCVQQTKINSTLAGGVTAIIPEDVRGETGDVVLLDKGARIFGTIQHGLMNGTDRLFVLWQNITTPVLYDASGMPHQYRVAVNSPAADQIGQTGLDGDVNHHYFKKIGGIIGLSLIQGGIQAGVSAASQNRGQQLNLNFLQSGSTTAADELLRAWINIPDVMTRDQGLACSIYVVRDLEMRAAYQLHRRFGAGE